MDSASVRRETSCPRPYPARFLKNGTSHRNQPGASVDPYLNTVKIQRLLAVPAGRGALFATITDSRFRDNRNYE
jgi:hypothetical protein